MGWSPLGPPPVGRVVSLSARRTYGAFLMLVEEQRGERSGCWEKVTLKGTAGYMRIVSLMQCCRYPMPLRSSYVGARCDPTVLRISCLSLMTTSGCWLNSWNKKDKVPAVVSRPARSTATIWSRMTLRSRVMLARACKKDWFSESLRVLGSRERHWVMMG